MLSISTSNVRLFGDALRTETVAVFWDWHAATGGGVGAAGVELPPQALQDGATATPQMIFRIGSSSRAEYRLSCNRGQGDPVAWERFSPFFNGSDCRRFSV